MTWLHDAARAAAEEAFHGYVRDLFSGRHLYYGRGVLRGLTEAEAETAGLELGDNQRLPSHYTIEQLTAWIYERARRLPCLPKEAP